MSVKTSAILCGIIAVMFSAIGETFGVAVAVFFTGMFAHLAGKLEARCGDE